MKEFLNHIRPPVQNIPIRKLLFTTFGVFLFGLIMGIFSKFLDCSPSNELPYVFELLDIRNFLGRFPIWLFLALLISVYSETPVWAGVRTFLFFTGMLISYLCLYKLYRWFFSCRLYHDLGQTDCLLADFGCVMLVCQRHGNHFPYVIVRHYRHPIYTGV